LVTTGLYADPLIILILPAEAEERYYATPGQPAVAA